MFTIALPKGRLLRSCTEAFKAAGLDLPRADDDVRQLVFDLKGDGVRLILARPSDVPTFVEHGAADIGIAGKDVLLESEAKVFELLDLGFGKGKFVLAAPRESGLTGSEVSFGPGARIATKYPNFTKRWLGCGRSRASVVYLRGAVELAPRVGLADAIVDLVSTGRTLAENHLKVVTEIEPISARLVANVVSYRLRSSQVDEIEKMLRSRGRKLGVSADEG